MHDVLTAAVAMHQEGRLPSAAPLYQEVLTREPENADALHLLGVLRHQQGSHAHAVTVARTLYHGGYEGLGAAWGGSLPATHRFRAVS